MANPLKLRRRRAAVIDPAAVVNSLADAVVVIAPDDTIAWVNHAAEQLFGAGASVLAGQRLDALVPHDSPLVGLLMQVRRDGVSISESAIRLDNPRTGTREMSIRAAPLLDEPGSVVATFHDDSLAHHLDRQLTHRNAARSVTAMAAMLAHEVKNPLSGIRGAAQLLEHGADDDERELTRLITEEADRIVALVNRMEVFADDRPPERTAVNIHEVLDHVRKLARTGFARHIKFSDSYDPSLPPVWGNRDQLVQVFLNLLKNAAEAVPAEGGEITLLTSFRQGLRLALPGSGTRVDLPLLVGVRDNGPGIPEDLRPHLFDPFVTTKPNGSGLGLALVAKIVGDHGGVVDIESQPRRTEFRVMLPKHPNAGEEVR